ncbi:MAG: pre-mRNA-splicing factor [Christensenellales bacterium]|jgi:hypothetical protein
MQDTSQMMIQKGKVSSQEGPVDRNGDMTRAKVLPSNADGVVTAPITIPWWLRGEMGQLAPGTDIAFALFEDGSGVILSRMDGNWPGMVPGDVEVLGNIKSVDYASASVGSYNGHAHTDSEGGTTSGPF